MPPTGWICVDVVVGVGVPLRTMGRVPPTSSVLLSGGLLNMIWVDAGTMDAHPAWAGSRMTEVVEMRLGDRPDQQFV